ncbi:hypothetical protein WA158_000909 [Blastocystis sp. Blastoise]
MTHTANQLIKPDYSVKLLIIGDSAVGKTCILMQYACHAFFRTYITTIGIDFKIKTINVEGKNIKLQIWDTAGQERFRTITTSYFRGAEAVMLVYSVTNRESFNSVTNWMQQIYQHADPEIAILLVGNKIDLEKDRVISSEEGSNLAVHYNIPFVETSAQNGSNIDYAFYTLTKNAVDRALTPIKEKNTIQLEQNKKQAKCCSS